MSFSNSVVAIWRPAELVGGHYFYYVIVVRNLSVARRVQVRGSPFHLCCNAERSINKEPTVMPPDIPPSFGL